MRIKKVRELITDAVLAERDRCAKLVEDEWARSSWMGDLCGEDLAKKIRSARPPEIRVIRPETAAKKPELVTRETIVAGTSHAGLD